MKIATGYQLYNNVKVLEGERFVSFLTEEGRVMFEVGILKDGSGIEIRGVDMYKHNGILYENRLEVSPVVSNVIEIRTKRYEE